MEKISIDEIKQIELSILKYISTVCDANNIRYMLAYGSVLGAVRHNGFIPWDDDIDVVMPRPDYEKFCSIVKKSKNNVYSILQPGDQSYPYPLAKVVDKRTRVKETSINDNINMGIWVDVFPIDGFSKSKWWRFKIKCLDICRTVAAHDSIKKFSRKVYYPFLFVFWKIARLIGGEFCSVQMNNLAKKVDFNNTEKVGYVMGKKLISIMPRSIYENRLKHVFESDSFYIPQDYHFYLTHIYGNDYMVLPPEEKREVHDFDAYYVIK